MPTMYMMIGPAGCGKSTLAKMMVEEHNKLYTEPMGLVSSDSIREELYGDEAIQGDNKLVFDKAHERIFEALYAGRDVVFDATNTVRHFRKDFIRECRGHGFCCVGIIYTGGLTSCIVRNEKRDRVVPPDVLERQWKQLNKTFPSFDEGFDYLVQMSSAYEAVMNGGTIWSLG